LTPMIELRSVTKIYGLVLGVNDISLELPAGAYGLLGPNGSGKSTLLKLLTGQLRPTEGTVRILGQDPWSRPALFRRLGYAPEQDAFYSFLSGFDFVRRLGRLSGLSASDSSARAEEVLRLVGADSYMHRAIGTYSKGMRQRTKVAQALVHDPEVLILDEPTIGADPVGRRELIDIVRSLAARGKSIIVASHILHEVQAMTKDFLLMFGGRILAQGNVDDIRGLMDEHPHRIAIRCERPRELAVCLLRDLPVDGVELVDGGLRVLTRDPHGFYGGAARVVQAWGGSVYEMDSQDDSLEAVFKYLVAEG